MKTSYKAEIEQYINTITDDALINFITQAFDVEENEIKVSKILFKGKGNELKTLTLNVLTIALKSIDEFLNEKIEDSEKLDWSLFGISANKIQSIVSDTEFITDSLASSVKIYEVPKETLDKTIVKEQMLGNNNIIYPDVKSSYVSSIKDINDDTITINVYASQFSVKPSKFIITAEDMEDDVKASVSEIYNSDYIPINVYIDTDSKDDLTLVDIDKNIVAEKKELINKLTEHLGELFNSLGIKSDIKAKYIVAMIATKDTKNLKDKLLKYDDEALKEIIRDKQKEFIADRVINEKALDIIDSFEKMHVSLNAINMPHTSTGYSIRTELLDTGEISIILFIEGFTKEEIIEIINKIKENYDEVNKKNGYNKVNLTCMLESQII